MSDKTKKKKVSFADRIRNLVKTNDADEAEKLAKSVEDSDIEIETDDSMFFLTMKGGTVKAIRAH